MSYAIEMKNLVENIKTSTGDRLKFVKNNKKDTQDLLARFSQELKDMAQNLKHSLNKSKKDREEDVKKLLTGFAGESKERAKDLKDFLAKSEETRMADFKTTMDECKKAVKTIQKYTTDLLSDCAKERKEARGYWETLRKKERAIEEEKAEEAEKEEKKAKK